MELGRGIVIAGRYRLESLLGQGGMGTVWAATHTVTRRKVALKFLKAPTSETPSLRKRFVREARAASLVDHPNVVRVHDVFELEDGTPLMVMEWIEGETLRVRLERAGVLSLAEAARVLLPVVSAVGAAHELGVVHRDLKPENVLLTPDGEPKVLDFGIAKLHGEEGATMTAAGSVLGTPCYMAPEQGFGEPDVDHRADVWALGVMLYEALSGGRPVEGESLGQVLKRLMEDGIAPLSAVAPDVPSDLAELVGRMLARERNDRPADLREVREVLGRYTDVRVPEFGPSGGRAADSIDETPAELEASGEQQDTAAPHTLSVAKSPARRAALIGMAVLMAVGALAWWRASERDERPVSASVPMSTPLAPTPSAASPVPAPAAATLEPLPEASERAAPRPLRPSPVKAAAPAPSASAPAPAIADSAAPTKPAPNQGGLVEEPPF